MQKRPLLGLTLSELQNVVKNLGMPGFSAKQIASWLYDKKVASIDEMSNLSLKHRELPVSYTHLTLPTICSV